MRALLFVLLLAAASTQVYGAATIADIYAAPSEATRYYGATNSTCQDGDTMKYCDDSWYGSSSDAYDNLGDGSTSSASSETVKDSGNSQSAFVKVIYDVDGLLSGSYNVRFGITADTPFDYEICVYEDANKTYVNTSSCKNFTHPGNDGSTWVEAEVTDLIRESADRYDNRIILRMHPLSGDTFGVTEMYLKRPFRLADFSLIAQGVSETEADHRVRNTWSIVSAADIPDITNASCDLHKLPYINESESDINMSRFNPSYEVGPNNEYFSVTWDANTSIDDFEEGFNYEVYCQGYLGELYMDGYVQYVYVNRERTTFEWMADLLAYVLQILGIVEDNQVYINQTRDIANQTLNLVQGLGGSVSVEPQEIVAYTGQNLTVLSALTVGTTPDDTADCKLKVYYPNATVWIEEQNMTSVGDDGLYKTNVVFEDYAGNYQAISTCTGGSLAGSARGLASWEVQPGVVMESIT